MVYKTNPDGTVEFVRGSNVKVTVTKDMNKDVFFEQDYKRIKMMEKCESLNRNNPIIQDGKKLCLICNQYITIGDFGDHLENHRVAINLKLKENGKDVSDIYVCAICGKELDASLETLKNIKNNHSKRCFESFYSNFSLKKKENSFLTKFNLMKLDRLLISKNNMDDCKKCFMCESLCLKSDKECLFCHTPLLQQIEFTYCKFCNCMIKTRNINKHLKVCNGRRIKQDNNLSRSEQLISKDSKKIKIICLKNKQEYTNLFKEEKYSLTPYIEEHSPVENQHLIREQGRFGSMPLYDNMD